MINTGSHIGMYDTLCLFYCEELADLADLEQVVPCRLTDGCYLLSKIKGGIKVGTKAFHSILITGNDYKLPILIKLLSKLKGVFSFKDYKFCFIVIEIHVPL